MQGGGRTDNVGRVVEAKAASRSGARERPAEGELDGLEGGRQRRGVRMRDWWCALGRCGVGSLWWRDWLLRGKGVPAFLLGHCVRCVLCGRGFRGMCVCVCVCVCMNV